MSAIQHLITEHLDIWTAADTGPKSGRGRSAANAAKVYGISKLRELILELAVRGNLVPQDHRDEPASKLLGRIQIEKAKLIKNGLLKKQKPQPDIDIQEVPFELPASWCWARLDNISPMSLADGDWIESKDQDPSGGIRLVQLADIGVGEFKDKSERFINQETFNRLNCTKLEEGDILIARLPAPIGRACIFPESPKKSITVVDVAILRPLGMFCSEYIVNAINSRTFFDQVESYGKGATRFRIATGNLKSLLVPLPPLTEQHRIVAKVDELMALCDQLEVEHNNATEAHEKLVSHLLGTLIQSQSAEDFSANWQRIATHFDALFTTESSIDALKQTLLQLAVMGKLVPQDPNDEPASELLKRIQAEKAKLIAEGGVRKQKELLPDGLQEPPYKVPSGWVWCHMDDLFLITGGVTLGRKLPGQSLVSKPYLRVANVQRGSLELDHMKEVEVPEGEVEKYSLKNQDLLITEGGDWDKVGRTAIWGNELPECLHQNHVFRARPLRPEWVSRWSEMYLNSAAAREYFAGSSKQTTNLASINMTQLRGCAFAVPPLAEQHRIVVKVDELMALCDQLKHRLTEAGQLQKKLADVLVKNAASTEAPPVNAEQASFGMGQITARTLLATEVVHQLNTEVRMGRVKLQKVINLAEYVAGLKEVASEPMRNAAGPHDRHFMDQVLQGMKNRQWYAEQSDDGGKSYHYRPLAQAGEHRADYEALWSSEQRRKISDLIALMRLWKTDQCERVATLYAAWNDLLIEGKEATEAAILHEVINRWNDSKLNYTKAQWQTELAAMKKHALLIPTGFGRRTAGGTQSLLPH